MKKMLDSGIAAMFDQIHDDLKGMVAYFAEQLQTTSAEVLWQDEYSQFMSRRAYDLLVKAVKATGIQDGHYRTPNKQDVLDGKSGNAFQDLCMVMLIEAGERRR